MSAPLDLDAVEALCSKITQGKWRWFGDLKFHTLYLATERNGRQYVMGFRRWGMGNAQPLFQSGGLLRTIHELADLGAITVKGYGNREVLSVQHPDMHLIEQASTLVPQLVARVRELEAANTVLDNALSTLRDHLPIAVGDAAFADASQEQCDAALAKARARRTPEAPNV